MLSTAHTTQHSIIGGKLINELETMWNQTLIAYSHMPAFANRVSSNATKRP
jgi:hypothetical protein